MRLGVAVLAGAAGAVAVQINQETPRISVTILVRGFSRPVWVAEPATVEAALETGEVVPRPGRLLSIVSRTVLDPTLNPVQLLVDGVPATPESPIVAGATIGVFEPGDET